MDTYIIVWLLFQKSIWKAVHIGDNLWLKDWKLIKSSFFQEKVTITSSFSFKNIFNSEVKWFVFYVKKNFFKQNL